MPHDQHLDAGPDAVFRSHLAAGRFMLQRCERCAEHVFYPRLLCPHCGFRSLAWVPASGTATVYATSVVRRRPEEGGAYNVALVDLAEGPRLMTRIEGVAPDAVAIGMTVAAEIDHSGEEPLLLFRASGGERS